MKYDVQVGGAHRAVTVRRAAAGGYWVSVDGGVERLLRGGRVGAAEWQIEEDGARRTIGAAVHGGQVHVVIGGHPMRVKVTDPRKDALALGKAGAVGAVITEMPGAVVRVLVDEGAQVTLGQPVVVVEAMKMENEFKAPTAGRVVRLAVAAGDRVESGALLLVIEPEPA